MKLYTYFRSTAAYRVRIALNLKGIDYEPVFVHLVKGEQLSSDYRALNPQALIPVLVDGERILTQSLAIIEYLDERYPEPPLLPSLPEGRARVRALAQVIACDIHPLINRRIQVYLRDVLREGEEAGTGWMHHWIEEGFCALESQLAGDAETGRFCHGDAPTLADACLVPQVFSARRYGCDLSPFPTIMRIHDACMGLEAFEEARPERQPDAE
jgi:maleylacetoacetate isomerase